MNLNFPEFSFQIKTEKNKNYIFDSIRKKYVYLTPEEWVRQHLIHFLFTLEYPQALMSVEKSLSNSKKRYDLVVYSKNGRPIMLVECKAPSVPIDQKTIDQASSYLQNMETKNVLLTNGLEHYFILRGQSGITVSKEIPAYITLSE